MEYTTKELAELCQTSTQSVRNYIKNNNLEDKTSIIRGRMVIGEELAQEICLHFGVELSSEVFIEEPEKPSNEQNQDLLVSVLLEQNKALNSQIEALNSQIGEKDKQIAFLQEDIAVRSKQFDALLETNRALSATNAIHTVDDKKEMLFADPVEKKEPQETKKKSGWRVFFGLD